MWGRILIGMLVSFIIIVIIKRIQNKMRYENEGDIWDDVKGIERDACSKIKDFLFGC